MTEPVHEPEPTPSSAQDRAWLAAHPRVLGAIIICRKLVIPLLLVVLPIYFNTRLNRTNEHAAAGYEALAPRVQTGDEQRDSMKKQIEDMKKLLLAQAVKPQPSAPAATIETNLALEKYKKDLVVKVQKSQSAPAPPLAPLPSKLDDVPTKK